MNEFNNQQQVEHELGWDDQIIAESPEFIVLTEGDYDFTINEITKERFNGSEKMPACFRAIVKMEINTPEGTVSIRESLLLHSKVEWRLSEFFECIGLKKKGEPLKMRWNIEGMTGNCHVKPEKSEDGKTYNRVKRFNPPKNIQPQQNFQQTVQPQFQQTFQQPAQPQFQQPVQPSTNNINNINNGIKWSGGSF